jgi:hypothetical protein
VPGIGFDRVKRFVGSAFLLALIARLSAAGLFLTVSNRRSGRMVCTHVVFYQVFTTVGVRPNTGLEAVVYLVAFPVTATLLAWASLELQDRLGRALGPGPLRRMVEAIP